jgi:DNA-binding GntR family transcriptional regulator
MQKLETIARDNISDEVARAVRDMIVEGRLPAGERINEVHLSTQLGVSRTPLREALAKLVQEGALRSIPRIGYFVRELSLEEFEQIYDIRPLLDPEALRLSGLPSKERMEHLAALNDKIERARDPNLIIDLDDEWHMELIADCPNKVLIDLIKQITQRTRRYEIALMREQKNVAVATANHKAILSALKKRDLDAACAALKHNMQTGREPIVKWLKGRDKKKGGGE